MKRNQWPKEVPELSLEQKAIADDFMHFTHEILPGKYNSFYNFSYGYPAKISRIPDGCKTLEIGPGLGEHLAYEDLQSQNYYCVELRQNMLDSLKKNYPTINAVLGDCQKRLGFEDKYFQRIIAIHVLEHLPDLPAAMNEIHRLLDDQGTVDVVIPCDPGVAYELVRTLTTKRLFKKRYRQPYGWLVRSEHINSPSEIMTLCKSQFTLSHIKYFPFPFIPLHHLNLAIGFQLRKK